MQHVVVLSLWSPRSPQSQTFNELLGQVVRSYEGRLTLAQVDVDTNPAIAQALGAQGVPLVVGLVRGSARPAVPGEPPRRRTSVSTSTSCSNPVAEQNGLTGRPPVRRATRRHQNVGGRACRRPAFRRRRCRARERRHEEGAVAEYEKLLNQFPGDTEIAERLAGVQLMGRTRDADLAAARAAAADTPDDIDAQLMVADLDVSGGHVQDAFDRLIELVKRLDGDDRERCVKNAPARALHRRGDRSASGCRPPRPGPPLFFRTRLPIHDRLARRRIPTGGVLVGLSTTPVRTSSALPDRARAPRSAFGRQWADTS